jgi:CPA1 family monovalent cation:H+ antiporter
VLALAAALSLPGTLADGTPFRHRDLIVFLTFSVILLTLVFQGLTLPWLIRFLGLARTPGIDHEGREGRRMVIEATLAHLEVLRQSELPDGSPVFDDVARQYRERLVILSQAGGQYVDVSMTLIDIERRTALHLRDEGRISDELLREIEHELDLNETRLKAAAHSGPAATAQPCVAMAAERQSIDPNS